MNIEWNSYGNFSVSLNYEGGDICLIKFDI